MNVPKLYNMLTLWKLGERYIHKLCIILATVLFVLFCFREKESMCRGWRTGEGERESQAASMLSAEPDAGLYPQDPEIMN